MRSAAIFGIVCLLSMAHTRALHAEEPVCPATRESLRVALYETRGAYERWEWEAFDANLAGARDALRCVDERLLENDLPLLFELEAFSAAMNDRPIQAAAAFRGLLQLAPGYELSRSLAPDGSLLRRAWQEAQTSPPQQTIPLDTGGWLVNGREGALYLPVGRAAVVQRARGELQTFWYDGVEPATEIVGREEQDLLALEPEAQLKLEEQPLPEEQARAQPLAPAPPTPNSSARPTPVEEIVPTTAPGMGVAQVGMDLGSLLTLHLAVRPPPGPDTTARRLDRVGVQGGLLLPIPLSSLATGDPVGTFDVPPAGLLFFFLDWRLSERLALQSSLDLLVAGTDPCGGAGLGLRFGPSERPLHAQLGVHVVGTCALPNPSSRLMMLPDLRLSLSL